MSEESNIKQEVEYVEVPAERSAVSQFLEAVGFFATGIVIAGIIVTIAVVWIDSSTLSGLRDKVYDARNDAMSAKSNAEYLDRRVRALENSHDEDHPDKKLAGQATYSNGGWIITGTSR
jgi:hypothetical protein